MKRISITIILAVIAIIAVTRTTPAQRNVSPALDRDPVLEADAKHNLDVARQAFLVKKAYKGVLMRFEETFAAYPTFSGIEEFLYLAGMSSYYLSENKGKQRIDPKNQRDKEKFAPAKLRDDSRAYLSLLIEKNPQTKYRDEAERTLKLLGPPS